MKTHRLTPNSWTKACRELSADDPVMRAMIKKYKGESLKSRGNAFETLLRSIVGQQISVKAAQSVWDKLSSKVDVHHAPALLKAETHVMRSAGLSERKVLYAKDLAQHFVDGRIDPHHWATLDDETVIGELVHVKGIGRWTAEMFLIFHLLRPNVFPEDDLGLQKGIALAYGKKYPMSQRQLDLFRKKYSPWATVATWYLWRSLDPIPVEY